jgi:hypothetical protein
MVNYNKAASKRHAVSEDVAESVLEKAAEIAGEAYLGPVGGAAASIAVQIVSRHGKRLITYWVNRNSQEVMNSLSTLGAEQGKPLPPFAVIGLGRCGSHVTAALAHMVAMTSQSGREQEPKKKAPPENIVGRLFRSKSTFGVLAIEPVMVVGDIDETTFSDVKGFLQESSGELAQRILRIDYQPLAVGGAGNVPCLPNSLHEGCCHFLPEIRNRPSSETDKGTARLLPHGKLPELI